MAVPFSNTKLRVPKGFQNILECLAREVLRIQPDNIHSFAAAYFENMLKVRAETGHDPAVHGAKLEDRNYNNEAFKQRSVDPSDPQQQNAAVKIQTQFRQHSAKEEVAAMRQEDAAMRIQAGFRGYLDRENVRKMRDGEDGSEAPAGQEEEEVDIDLNDPEVEKAAIKIQAGFKGFKARKEVHGENAQQAPAEEAPAEDKTAEAGAPQEEEVDIDLDDPEVSKAALKIQAGFRGHQARKDLEQKKRQREELDVEEHEITQEEDDLETKDLDEANDLDDPERTNAALTIQREYREYRSRKETVQNSQKQTTVYDLDLDDPTVNNAAMRIQVEYRSYRARKGHGSIMEQLDEEAQQTAEEAAPEPEQKEEPQGEEEEVDIDLEDPEVEKAAVKIQAGFKGLKARKQLKQKTEDAPLATEAATEEATQEAAPTEEKAAKGGEDEEVDIDLDDPATEKAALKIQAGFRGYQTRKDMKQGEPGEESSEAKPEEAAPAEDTAATTDAAQEKEGDAAADAGGDAPAGGGDEGGEAEQKAEGHDEEEVDIDLNDPEVEKATIKIQAGFKGFKARKELQSKQGEGETSAEGGEGQTEEAPAAAEEGQAQEGQAEGQEAEKTEAPAETEQAPAETEQAPAETEQAPAEETGEKKEEEEIDIDLEDPEVEKAALKIQAGFKGMRTRKEVRVAKDVDQDQVAVDEPEEVAEVDEAEEVADIAQGQEQGGGVEQGETQAQEPDEM